MSFEPMGGYQNALIIGKASAMTHMIKYNTSQERGTRFVLNRICCDQPLLNCRHILQDYFTAAAQIMRLPDAMEATLNNMDKYKCI